MLTVFAVPKAFLGHVGVIQVNALESWARLRPQVEVLLFGNEPGVADVAKSLGFCHVPDIPCTEYGTPLVGAAFRLASTLGNRPYLCYANADIILFRDLVDAAQRIRFQRYLMVGRRWDIELNTPVDFDLSDWEAKLRTLVRESGSLHLPAGSDYFLFPRDSGISDLPDFAVGRPGWDNWLIWHTRDLHVPVIDASKVVTAVHQSHDYAHVVGGNSDNSSGPELERNLALLGSDLHRYTLADATHVLGPHVLVPAIGRRVNQRLLATRSFRRFFEITTILSHKRLARRRQ